MTAAAALSVVVPCYNNAAFVAEAIASIIAQSVPPAQVIVVDDGSTDASAAQVARFAPAVTLLRQPNRGAAAARNTGVAAAIHPLVAFLDADDAWPHDRLAVMLAAQAAANADLVFGAVRQCLGSVGPAAPPHGAAIPGRLPGSMLLKRCLFTTIGAFDESLRSAEMIDWVARATAFGITQASVPDIVLYRRIHGANMMLTAPDPDRGAFTALRRAVARRRA